MTSLKNLRAQTIDTTVLNLGIKKLAPRHMAHFLTNFDIKIGILVVIFLRFFLRQFLLSKESFLSFVAIGTNLKMTFFDRAPYVAKL